MLKLEQNMINRILEGKASIEFQVEAFKVLGESLDKIEAAIKEGKEVATKIDIKVIESELNKEIKPETKEESVVTETAKKEEIKTEAKRQISRNMMVKCGKNEGDDEVVYIEKKGDGDIHTWQGQIRLDNVVYNFHWSNELSLPVVYNVPDLSYVLIANDMIKERVGVKE